MATVQKLKFLGYVDYCTAVSQIVISLVSTVVSLYYYYGANLEGNVLPYFAPTINLSITAIVLFVNGGQIICAKQLIQPGTDFICVAEMKRIRHYWTKWNNVTLLVDFIWFPYFSLAFYMKQSLLLASILICFLVTLFIRLVVSCTMLTMRMEPVMIPEVYVDPPIEMRPLANLD